MTAAPFVHLHCHTDYSLLDGACEIKQLMELVEKQNMPAVAMTDHGNLFGAVQFYDEAHKRGIKPIIGCEAYVTQQSRSVTAESNRYNHLVLLCENLEGYRNLIQLVSSGYLDGFYYKPRIDKDLLAAHSKGLIALSACLRGEVNETLLEKEFEEGRRLAYTYLDIFGKDNFFLEVQDHGLEQDRKLLPNVYRLSQQTGIPLVATNDSHYLRREDARAHEVLLCIQTGKTMSDPARMKWSTPDFYLKSRDEMLRLFGDCPEALDHTWDIAQRCNLKLEKVKEPFPRFDVPEGHTADTYFEFVAREGFERRRPRLEMLRAQGRLKHDLPEYMERLDSEIRMIQKMKFSGYFLIVWDFIRFAKSRGIPVGPGRGSAAGSLVSYAMQITDLDPLEHGLLFERFLNPERISMPDIDIDFCMNRRGEVIQYVTEKYGRDRVAQIITFSTLGTKAAIKDVGRALDLPYGDVDRLTKLVPNVLNIKLKTALEQEARLREAAQKDPRIGEVMEIAQRLEGVARNASVHAAGVVISPQPLQELVPLYKTNRDEIVTQYDMNGLEKLSLLKMDFLGLATLTVVDDALKLIEAGRGEKIVLEELPLEDPETYAIFSRGFTSGVFQFESEGMRDILRRYQPTRLEDLTALNALYRPGPIQGGMIPDFIDRKHGRRPVTYDLPELEEILAETYGVILYQEQVMQISNRIAGYSLGEADILRRAMGKKKPEEMAAQRERFIAGAVARGFPRKKVEKLFDLMEQFAGYGFNKSHSAAYAYLAFVTAYLKAHYPVEFMSALLSSETGNTAKIVKYINECREMGIRVLPPDVNSSDWNFTPAGEAIRFGLGAVRNLGQNAVAAIHAARNEVGRFRSLFHFCEHVDLKCLNKRTIESMIKAGAMDGLGGTRAQLFAAVDRAIEAGQKANRDRESGQHALFGMPSAADAPQSERLPEVEPWSEREQLKGEKEVLGFYVTGHPLNAYEEKIRELATADSSTIEALAAQGSGNADVALCGIISNVSVKRNREGKPWAAVQLEDRSGNVDLLIFAAAFESLRPYLEPDQAVLVRGTLRLEENSPPKVAVSDITPLDNARIRLPGRLSIRIRLVGPAGEAAAGSEIAEKLAELFRRKPGDTDVCFRLERPGDFLVLLDSGLRVRADREFCEAASSILGPGSVEIVPV
ncbi:MAG TPA: DNA polymerase III subunit alpha [Bryobacterales bacterium]|jgi:DNA polymerase-3 subunit alpha|nr:DNA polymerase III subunit alpha [Bryobacterales bacterium]